MSLEWRDQLSVGNDLIDADHKHLIEVVNLAEHGLKTKNRQELTEVLDNLSRYARVHFVREELFAGAVSYPGVNQMHESHEELMKTLERVKHDISEQWSQESLDHFSDLLRGWLVNHVIKEDMLMKPYFKKFSPRFDPR
jgi:hemerythrin